MKGPSLARRLLLSSLLGLAMLLPLGGFALSWAFRRSAATAFDDRVDAWSQAVVAALNVGPGGSVSVARPLGDPRFDRPLSGWYWEVSTGRERLSASRSLWDAELEALDSPASGEPRFATLAGPRGVSVRTLVRSVALPGLDRRLRVQVAVDDGQLRQDVERFDALLWISLGGLGLGILALGAAQMRLVLRPLRTLRRELDAVRSGTEERIGVGAAHELVPLVESLNALLDRDAARASRARDHAADLAHALKTPLSLIRAEAEELGGARGERIVRHADAMSRHLERRLVRALEVPVVAGRCTPMAPVLRALADTLRRLHPGCAIEIEAPGEPTFRGAREDLEEIAGNLLENACKWARGRVRVRAVANAGTLELCIEDDGPGLDAAGRARARERGTRLDESAPGFGLGLAIVEEIAALHGGELVLEEAALGGLRALVRLPVARPV